ncbi:hypothetical protein KSF_017510 [Reticulibacter mediterranei]|uniref:TIR domain-containing protein n=2 Tax=Reticulibacter mediterranei TaxID=2778369 RepID=A0A8J3N0N9_9CHLR|nr:hypothetical protein KSF_017510 [Reticulibacter mediterranei]
MTLDQYAIGKPDSFCYWLEFKTNELGGIRGGNAAKFGVWWSKSEDRWRWNSSYQNAENALASMKRGLLELIAATRNLQFDKLDKIGADLLGYNRYSLRGKPLYLYFPEYFLPISNPEHLRYFLGLFGEKPKGDLLELNRQLLAHLQSLPQFDGFDTLQMMIFLYECMPPKKGSAPPKSIHQQKQIDPVDSSNNNRTTVFISYSHENQEELNRLLLHLRATKLNNNTVKWWDDTQIKPGALWDEEIKKAMASAYVAILLVSIDYLASEFILKHELPSLLTAAEDDGVIILPVILGPCNFKYTELARFQAVNNPSIPLSKMNKHEADEVWNKVVEILHEMKPKDF